MKNFKIKLWVNAIFMTMLIIATSLAIGISHSDARDNKPIKLRVSSALSINHAIWEGFFVPWMDRVKEETNGQVDFDYFMAGELVSGGEEYEALRDGVIDIGAPLMPIYDPDRFPTTEVTMLPLKSSNALIAAEAFEKMLRSDREIVDGKTFHEMEYEANGVIGIGVNIASEATINTTGYELNSIDDLRNITLRVGTRPQQLYANIVGFRTVSMPAFDIYDALSRGTIDGSFIHIADWTAYGFEDLFKYALTGFNFGHFSSVLGMTTQRWEELPENIRQIFIESANEARKKGAQEWMDRENEIIEKTSKKGVKFVEFSDLPEDVYNEMANGQVEVWKVWIDRMENRGIPGKAVARLWRDCVVESGGEVFEDIDRIFE